jgi:CheY-like chemotaxis protein
MARVLVVDDEPDLCDLLRLSLGLAGHDVSVAADGHAGLELARDQRPDAIVLDVTMPVLDGWAVLTTLKSDPDPSIAAIPVLMLTGRAEDLDVIRGGIEGAVRYLTKPFAISNLRKAVSEAIGGAPEPEQRRAAQHAALAHLVRLERGTGPAPAARPRLSGLEPVSRMSRTVAEAPRSAPAWPVWLTSELLSARDREILEAVLSCGSAGGARSHLHVSRSYVYARLRRMAGKFGFESGPALVQALRVGNGERDGAPRPPCPPGPWR